MSKFSEFLQGQKIDLRRVASASQQLEKLRVEDRAARLRKRQERAAEGGTPKEGAEAPPKRRSGRPVTRQLLQRATEGKPVTGPAKTRLLRAVNRVLEQKKQEPAQLKQLF